MVEKFWFERSKEFMDLAKKNINEGYYWFSCFASQQSVEFFLKGILVKFKGYFPFTYDLGELMEIVSQTFQITVSNEIYRDCDILTPHYVMSRYSQSTSYDRRRAEECVESANRVINWIKEKINV
ncbi:MAG: HEPN domain-containing protein [Sulfolobus sp.]|nr:HEPN domain-containing protein [Sulfolobus sp.]